MVKNYTAKEINEAWAKAYEESDRLNRPYVLQNISVLEKILCKREGLEDLSVLYSKESDVLNVSSDKKLSYLLENNHVMDVTTAMLIIKNSPDATDYSEFRKQNFPSQAITPEKVREVNKRMIEKGRNRPQNIL